MPDKNLAPVCGLHCGSLGDPALNAEEAKQAVLARRQALMRRKNIGTDRWLAER